MPDREDDEVVGIRSDVCSERSPASFSRQGFTNRFMEMFMEMLVSIGLVTRRVAAPVAEEDFASDARVVARSLT
jgi:hypothetical protein